MCKGRLSLKYILAAEDWLVRAYLYGKRGHGQFLLQPWHSDPVVLGYYTQFYRSSYNGGTRTWYIDLVVANTDINTGQIMQQSSLNESSESASRSWT